MFFATTASSEYLALMPVNCGTAPAELLMAKVFAGSVLSAEFGSLKSLSVSSPVFVIVVVTFRFSTSVTSVGPVACQRREVRVQQAEGRTSDLERHGLGRRSSSRREDDGCERGLGRSGEHPCKCDR